MTPQELKNSILQLAIQGRLVEQRPEEGTAEELYRQIQQEKAALVKAGKIKKEKPLPEITEEEMPFEIPEGWKWVRVGEYVQKVTDYVASGSFASLRENVKVYKEPNYAILVKTKDFQSNFTEDLTFTDEHGYEFLENSRLFGGELIMPNIGASIGKVFTVPYLEQRMTLAPNSILIRFIVSDHLDWFSYYFQSQSGYSQLKGISSSTAQAKFSKTEFKLLCIPIPPLAEQKRIVAKIEELLPYIDRYEKAWSRLEDFNKRFPTDMQKSILQLAIQGKLVPQRPEEGTGEALYQQIQAEKQSLIRSGKLKKEKPLPEITPDEIPFEIPENWKWIRLGKLTYKITDGTHKTPKYTEAGIPFVSAKDIYDGKLRFDKCRYISEEEHSTLYSRCNPEKGDILISKSGSIGTVVINEADYPFSLFESLALVKYSQEFLSSSYLKYAIRFACYRLTEKEVKGVAVKHLPIDAITKINIPLPPLAEQKRIVAKLEELLPLCERLK